jgi:glycine oxidase
MTAPDTVIIGGGVIGLTIARALHTAGQRVLVLDRDRAGAGASWAGAGILPPWGPGSKATALDSLRAASVAKFAAMAGQLQDETGIDPGYRVTGGFEIIAPDDEVIELWQHEQIEFEHCGDRCYFPGMAQVRNPRLLRALITANERSGITIHSESHVMAIPSIASRVLGVTVNNNFVSAGNVVIAAGAWAEELLKPFSCNVGIHPVRGQIVQFASEPGACPHIVIRGKQYVVPREDGLVLAGSTEEPEASFTLGNTDAAIASLIRFSIDVAPALKTAKVQRTWSGLRPGSADGWPTIDRVPGQSNLYAAVGHFRAGIQLSLATAELIAALMLGTPPSVESEPFAFCRSGVVRPKPAFRS